MTEDELKKIKDSFVRTDETGGASASAACLMTAIKYYGGTTTWEQVKEWCKSEPGHAAHALTEAARRAGFTVVPDLMDIERLKKHDIPTILYMYNDFDRMNYAVCYGMHENRFIVWEPEWGPMQYWESELKTLWKYCIAYKLYPDRSIINPTLEWWQIDDWDRRLKHCMDRCKEFIELEILPRFR